MPVNRDMLDRVTTLIEQVATPYVGRAGTPDRKEHFRRELVATLQLLVAEHDGPELRRVLVYVRAKVEFLRKLKLRGDGLTHATHDALTDLLESLGDAYGL